MLLLLLVFVVGFGGARLRAEASSIVMYVAAAVVPLNGHLTEACTRSRFYYGSYVVSRARWWCGTHSRTIAGSQKYNPKTSTISIAAATTHQETIDLPAHCKQHCISCYCTFSIYCLLLQNTSSYSIVFLQFIIYDVPVVLNVLFRPESRSQHSESKAYCNRINSVTNMVTSKRRRATNKPTKKVIKKKQNTPKPTSSSKKRRAVDVNVVKKYAEMVKANRDRQAVNVHVVKALTMQHGNSFPVALNSGTRPRICSIMRQVLGSQDLYEELCPSAADAGLSNEDQIKIPDLPAQIGNPPGNCNLEVSEESLLQRFPSNANLLLENGAQRITLLHQPEVKFLMDSLSCECSAAKWQKLSRAQGNGTNGAYCAIDQRHHPLLRSISGATKQWIETNTNLLKPLGEKSIMLRHGLGGINYAHHDNSGEFQALLMLSRPNIDYTGGNFCLMESHPPHTLSEFPFQAAGQIIIFRGDKSNYLHGMTEVLSGSAEEASRFAVGMFQ